MSLNIKNPEAHRLAARVAAVTGESLTEAVTKALQERLAQLQQPDKLAEELMRIASDCAPRFKEPWRSVDHGELLYDDKGMPK